MLLLFFYEIHHIPGKYTRMGRSKDHIYCIIHMICMAVLLGCSLRQYPQASQNSERMGVTIAPGLISPRTRVYARSSCKLLGPMADPW